MKTVKTIQKLAFSFSEPKGKALAMVLLLIFFLQLMLVNTVCSLPIYNIPDSTLNAEQKIDTPKDNFSSTIRLNSMGYFGYGGRIVSDYQSFDANLIYERNKWGTLLYKVVDLYDSKSSNNFAMAMVFTKVNIGKRITITPYAGMVIEQLESLADKDSDFATIVNAKIKLNQSVSLDHTAILSNLVLAPSHMDWVNRIRLMFDSGHYNLTWLGWHNNRVLDNTSYYSSGISATYNKIALSDNIYLNTGFTAFKMIHASSEEVHSKKDGLLLTIALVIN